MDNLKGDFELFKSAISGVALSFGDVLEPKLRSGIKTITEVVSGFGDMSEWSKNALIDLTLFGTGAGITFKVFGTGTKAIGGFVKKADDFVERLNLAHQGLNLTTGTLGLWTAGIGLAVGAVGGLVYWLATADERLAEFNKNITNHTIETQEALKQSQSNVKTATEGLAEIQRLENEISKTSNKDELVKKEQELLTVKKQMLDLFPELSEGYGTEEEALSNVKGSLDDYIKKQEELIELKKKELAMSAQTYFNKNKDNRDISKELNDTTYAQKNLDQLIKKKEELMKLDPDAILSGKINGVDYETTVSRMMKIIDSDMKKVNAIIDKNSTEISEFKTNYEALAEAGYPVSASMTNMYENIKNGKKEFMK